MASVWSRRAPGANDFRQRAILPDKFEPEVNFDCLALRQAELFRFFNVAGDLAWQ